MNLYTYATMALSWLPFFTKKASDDDDSDESHHTRAMKSMKSMKKSNDDLSDLSDIGDSDDGDEQPVKRDKNMAMWFKAHEHELPDVSYMMVPIV